MAKHKNAPRFLLDYLKKKSRKTKHVKKTRAYKALLSLMTFIDKDGKVAYLSGLLKHNK